MLKNLTIMLGIPWLTIWFLKSSLFLLGFGPLGPIAGELHPWTLRFIFSHPAWSLQDR